MVSSAEKLEEIFRTVFELPDDADVRSVRQISLRKWDSLGHILLVSAIENEFGVQIDPVESISMTSFEAFEAYLSEPGVDGS